MSVDLLSPAIARIRTGFYVRHLVGDQFALLRHGGNKFGSVLIALGDADHIKARYLEKVKP